MKIYLFLSLSLFFLTQSTNRNQISKFLSKSLFSSIEDRYIKYPAISIKALIPNKNLYIVDVRNNTISNLGFLENSLLLPLTMAYETWFPAVIKETSNVILICDESNYKEALEKTESLGPYHIFGYAIYDEIIKEENFNIQVAEYNENTKEDVEKLVANGEYLLDIREISEYNETGVIKEANLFPLSTFNIDYVNLPKDVDVYVFCKGGGRALSAMSFAKRAGFTNKFIIMRGGMGKTINEGYPLGPYDG